MGHAGPDLPHLVPLTSLPMDAEAPLQSSLRLSVCAPWSCPAMPGCVCSGFPSPGLILTPGGS